MIERQVGMILFYPLKVDSFSGNVNDGNAVAIQFKVLPGGTKLRLQSIAGVNFPGSLSTLQ